MSRPEIPVPKTQTPEEKLASLRRWFQAALRELERLPEDDQEEARNQIRDEYLTRVGEVFARD